MNKKELLSIDNRRQRQEAYILFNNHLPEQNSISKLTVCRNFPKFKKIGRVKNLLKSGHLNSVTNDDSFVTY